MKVMILAAGRGERMGNLTQNCPKPLLKVKGRCLIEWHLIKLCEAGFKDIVINVAYLSKEIMHELKNSDIKFITQLLLAFSFHIRNTPSIGFP